MNWLVDHILSIILFLPTAGALVIVFLPGKPKVLQRFAFGISLLVFAFSLVALLQFEPSLEGFQMQEQTGWFGEIQASYHVGVDGISLALVLLTTLLTPLALLTSFNINQKVKAYLALFMLLETGMLGVFLALDLLLFFVFWEVGLVPMYFLINQWGGQNRNYASLKFILFTMGGSLGLLLSTQLIGITTGTFDLPVLQKLWPKMNELAFLGLSSRAIKGVIFWAFVVAFAVKVPVWPVHTWLPDAHTEAPTAGSMILAGVLLKLGGYGFLRLVLPLFPVESHQFAWALAILAALSIILGGFGAFGQSDFKRLVAYSSVNHMGFVMLGIAVAAYAAGSENAHIAVSGSVLQMITHGLSSAGMFFLVGVLYDRAHTRDLKDFGGIYSLLPLYGSLLVLLSMAALGLPGMGGFISEFLIIRGSWPVFTLPTTFSMIGLFFTGAYILKAIKMILHGPVNESWSGMLTDMTKREVIVISPLALLLVVIGIWPAWVLNLITASIRSWF